MLRLRNQEIIRTTVSLPSALVERSQRFIDDGTVANRNALVVAAVESFLNEMERERIDQAFAAMADDAAYLGLDVALAEEFALSDWETLAKSEEDHHAAG